MRVTFHEDPEGGLKIASPLPVLVVRRALAISVKTQLPPS